MDEPNHNRTSLERKIECARLRAIAEKKAKPMTDRMTKGLTVPTTLNHDAKNITR